MKKERAFFSEVSSSSPVSRYFFIRREFQVVRTILNNPVPLDSNQLVGLLPVKVSRVLEMSKNALSKLHGSE